MNPATSQHMEEVLMKIGNLFSISYEIIEKILTPLGYHDLSSAIQVCESWLLVGQPILEKRKLRYLTLHLNGLKNTDLQVVNNLPSPFETLEEFLSSINYKSFHCLGFSCGGWINRTDIITKFSPNGLDLCDLFKQVFSQNCKMAILEASGVVGSVQNKPPFTSEKNSSQEINLDQNNHENSTEEISQSFNGVGYSIELEEQTNRRSRNYIFMEAVTLLLLPKQPGVKFKIFTLDERRFHAAYRNKETDTVAPWKRDGLLNLEESSPFPRQSEVSQVEFNSLCGLEPQDELKALLIFTDNVQSFVRSFIDAAQFRENDQVALGGGMIDWVRHEGDMEKGSFGMAISGRNVQTASIVIPSSVKDVKHLKSRLTKLKEKGLPEGHSICFMFACCGRGSSWYKKHARGSDNGDFANVETRAFRELFPNTPIFGFFGDGEIGINFYSRDEEGESSSASFDGTGMHQFRQRKKLKRRQNVFHQFSSIFVLVSFL